MYLEAKVSSLYFHFILSSLNGINMSTAVSRETRELALHLSLEFHTGSREGGKGLQGMMSQSSLTHCV